MRLLHRRAWVRANRRAVDLLAMTGLTSVVTLLVWALMTAMAAA